MEAHSGLTQSGPKKILFFGNKEHWATARCLKFLSNMKCDVESYLGVRGDKFPEDLGWSEYDLVISFSSPWIIPLRLLEKAFIGAINFHPGPPEYPGIGCTNFAIYDEKMVYGVTCHLMAEKVDTGPIIMVRRFPLFPNDTVKSLTDRCYYYMYAMFVDVVGIAVSEARLITSAETWKRQPYTRKQLNDLCCIELDMSPDEIRRRVRATSYPGYPGAHLELHGISFQAD